MKPTVGRIVHYTNLGDADGKYPPETQAAIITKVTPTVAEAGAGDESAFDVQLAVFYPTGLFFMDRPVPYWTASKRGHWTWPPREG